MSNMSVLVHAEIIVDDPGTASLVGQNILNNLNLTAQGLPEGTIVSVVTQFAAVESSSVTSGTVVWSTIVSIVLFSTLAYPSLLKIRHHYHYENLRKAIQECHSGEPATNKYLPPCLTENYIPIRVIGKSNCSCVIVAKGKDGCSEVAIKLCVPKRYRFSVHEHAKLSQEAAVLKMFTSHHCEEACSLAGISAVTEHIDQRLCWFIMNYIDGENLKLVLYGCSNKSMKFENSSEQLLPERNPVGCMDCIIMARSVLAALKIMHSEGLLHRDIKPANIIRCKAVQGGQEWDGVTYNYKLMDYRSSCAVDLDSARTPINANHFDIHCNDSQGDESLPYMSPEMYSEPSKCIYSSDLWSLGVTMFELLSCTLPFHPSEQNTYSGWCQAIAGDMDVAAPNILDKVEESKRSKFDHNLAKVISKALEKTPANRFLSTDEMHDAVYHCLVVKGEAFYTVFISYRVASEAPLAQLLFDELNHSVTPGGHRVTVYWDAHRLVKGQDWEDGFASGLLNSLVFLPLLSYGSTAPLAQISESKLQESIAKGWDARPVGRERLQGLESDPEDNVLKELLIATTLLERNRNMSETPKEGNKGILQEAYPILVGRQHPAGHPDFPKMGNFFQIQGGGGQYPKQPSPATNRSVVRFLREKCLFSNEALHSVERQSVATVVQSLTRLQGCQLWNHSSDLQGIELTKTQKDLKGKGCVGPPVCLDGVVLNSEQKQYCLEGFSETQLCMLKAQVRAKKVDIHEIIDRTMGSCSEVLRQVSQDIQGNKSDQVSSSSKLHSEMQPLMASNEPTESSNKMRKSTGESTQSWLNMSESTLSPDPTEVKSRFGTDFVWLSGGFGSNLWSFGDETS